MAFDKSLMSIKTTSVYKCFPEIHRLQHGRQQLLCDSVISHPLVYFYLESVAALPSTHGTVPLLGNFKIKQTDECFPPCISHDNVESNAVGRPKE